MFVCVCVCVCVCDWGLKDLVEIRLSIKGALCRFGEDILEERRESSSLTDFLCPYMN